MERLKEINKICVVGDSVLRPVIYDEEAQKYTIYKSGAVYAFEESYHIPVVNCSRFGCTIGKAFDILKKVLVSEKDFDTVLIELGGNDSDYNWDLVSENPNLPHLPHTPETDFMDILCEMIETILNEGKRPFIMNLPPIDYERYFNWIVKNDAKRAENILSFLGDKSYIYRHQELYSRMLENAALKYELYRIDVREKFLSIPHMSEYLCIDGIHPNEKGHVLIETAFSKAYAQQILHF